MMVVVAVEEGVTGNTHESNIYFPVVLHLRIGNFGLILQFGIVDFVIGMF